MFWQILGALIAYDAIKLLSAIIIAFVSVCACGEMLDEMHKK